MNDRGRHSTHRCARPVRFGTRASASFSACRLAIAPPRSGGLAIGALAFGGAAIGGFAAGGGAVGIVAIGGFALGHFAAGGAAVGTYPLSPLARSPEAIEFFRQLRQTWQGR